MKSGELTVLMVIQSVIALSASLQTGGDTLCNGSPDLCSLQFNQATLAGSNSAGSGSSGSVVNCNGDMINDCLYQNQHLSITGQLEIGIRFLSLETCVRAIPPDCETTVQEDGTVDASLLVSCQGGEENDMTFRALGYGEQLLDTLREIDAWMQSNPREVIGVHFTGRIQVNRTVVVNTLVPTLEAMWGEEALNSSTSSTATGMNSFFTTNPNAWPTLGQAVDQRRRIFVFMDDSNLISGDSVPIWINPTPTLNAVVTGWNQACDDLLGFPTGCSNTAGDEYLIAVGYTRALCIFTGQDNCNSFIQGVTDMCYQFREAVGRTVNVVLVDFPERGTGTESVFNIVADLNDRNVRRFLRDTPTVTTDTAGSGHRSPGPQEGPTSMDEETEDTGETEEPTSSAGGVAPRWTTNTVTLMITLSFLSVVGPISRLYL